MVNKWGLVMRGLAVYWWVPLLFSTWLGVFLVSDKKKFMAYYPGGLWSVALGCAIEYVIRRNMGYWELERALPTLLGVGIVTFIGPRFVEGLLFFQLLPRQTSLQLPTALIWALGALITDIFAVLSGFAHLNLKTGLVSWLSHTLRFTALLALYYGLSYERRVEYLGLIRRQHRRRRWGKALWKLSWIPFYIGVRALVGTMDRRQK